MLNIWVRQDQLKLHHLQARDKTQMISNFHSDVKFIFPNYKLASHRLCRILFSQIAFTYPSPKPYDYDQVRLLTLSLSPMNFLEPFTCPSKVHQMVVNVYPFVNFNFNSITNFQDKHFFNRSTQTSKLDYCLNQVFHNHQILIQ